MYELIQAVGNSYYIDCPAKIGLYRINEQEVCLFDSGSDKDAGRKVRRILDENGWQLRAIYNTHSHADHIGGNRFLQDRTACDIFAAEMECDVASHPLWEPAMLWGAQPPKELQNKFLMAQESRVQPLTAACLPAGVELIPLPGHCYEMVGFRTPDQAVYLADCVSGAETLQKYRIAYQYDVGAALQTLEAVKNLSAKLFIPSHSAATEDIVPLAQLNIDCILQTGEEIVRICRDGAAFEEILQRLFQRYELTLTFQQYALIGSTLRAYLTWLLGQNRLRFECTDGRMLWFSI